MSSENKSRTEIGNDRLINLLRDVDRELAQSATGHLADDDMLLDRWFAGHLSEDEHASLLKHLASCYECSEFVQEMTHAGMFQQSDDVPGDQRSSPDGLPADAIVGTVPPVSQATSNQRGAGKRWLFAAIVASALFALLYFAIPRGHGDPSDIRLAQADRSLLTHYLSEAEFASVAAGQYAKSLTTGFVPPDARRDRQIEQLARRLVNRPNSTSDRLNHAQLLLEAGRFEDAESEFRTVLKRDPDNTYARLGIGLVLFRQKKIVEAEPLFAALVDDPSVGSSARLNQILSMIGTGRLAEARQSWKLVPPDARQKQLQFVLEAGMGESETR